MLGQIRGCDRTHTCTFMYSRTLAKGDIYPYKDMDTIHSYTVYERMEQIKVFVIVEAKFYCHATGKCNEK